MADVGVARVEVEGDVRNFARQTQRDLDRALDGIDLSDAGDKLGAKLGDGIYRGVDGRLRDSRGRFVKSFSDLGAESAAEMAVSIGRSLGVLPRIFQTHPAVAAAGVALATGLAAAVAPALGGLLTAALISGGGLAALAGGIALVANRPEIKQAAQSIKDRFLDIDTSDLEAQILAARDRLDKARKSKNKAAIDEARKDLKTLETELSKAQAFNAKNFSLRDAAAPLINPLIEALKTFVTEAQPIIEQLGTSFKTLADSGAVQALATGLTGLVTAALPGFNELIEVAGPFLVMLGEQLPIIGAALGEFFRAIAGGAPGATVFFQDFVKWVSTTIIALAQIIAWLANAYISVKNFFTGAATFIQSAITWFAQFGASVIAYLAPIIPAFQGVWNAASAVVSAAWRIIVAFVQSGIALVKGIIAAASAAIRGDWQGTWNAIRNTVSVVIAAIRSITSSGMAAIRSVISGAVQAVRATWSAGWNGFLSTTRNAVNQVRGIISGVRATVQGAFASAASWLVSAGSKIISGLISGIQAGFGRVRSLLGSLTSMLPDWKGPAEVDRDILRNSGKLVMQGFEGGLRDEFDSIRKTLGELTGGLPGFTGPVRGGDGAISGGARTLTVMPGAIVIQGGGAAAGQEAAEALLEALANAQN